ncbi:hypothetical protein ABK040_003248 [Willaertia magna]
MSSGTQEINEVWNELNQVLLTINKKVFEPLKQELEIANQVFNTVNNTTKLALKEFVFLKRKEEIFLNVNNENKEEENNTKNNKEKIPSGFGEENKIKLKKQTSTTTENTDPQQKKENSLQALRTIQQKVSSKSISNNTNKPIVSSNPIKTQPSPKPSSKPTVVQKKTTAPITGNSSKQNKASLKTIPSNKSKPSLVTAPTTSSSIKNVKNSKIETEGKRRNLDDILKLARNIRQKEEEEFDEKIVELSCSERKSRIEQNSSNGKSIKEEIKTKVENQSEEEENNQKKLPFTTFEQRFDHFSSLLTNIRDLNEKTDESFKKLSSVTGWEIDLNLSFENETVQENLTKQKESNGQNKIYTQYLEFIREVCEKTLEKGEVDESDLQEFKGNFVFDEEEMDELEKELLEKTIDKNSSPPPVLSVNTVYNDIPNTYISRWLPKRVNKNITNILVPKVMKKKIDPKRANYNMYYFMFSDPEELRQVIELRYSIQYLLLRKFIYDKLFKEYKLQDYVEKLKHDPNITREYGKLLRILKSIANDRNNTLSRQAIDLTSYYNAKPVTNNDQTNNKDEQEDDNIIEALQYRPVLDWCSFNNN